MAHGARRMTHDGDGGGGGGGVGGGSGCGGRDDDDAPSRQLEGRRGGPR